MHNGETTSCWAHMMVSSCFLSMPTLRSSLEPPHWNFSDLSSPVLPGVYDPCLQTRATISSRLLFSQGRPKKPKILASSCSRRLCKNIGLEVDPQRVLTDFELALEQSIAISFPQAKKKRCPTDICESDLEGVEGWRVKLQHLIIGANLWSTSRTTG